MLCSECYTDSPSHPLALSPSRLPFLVCRALCRNTQRISTQRNSSKDWLELVTLVFLFRLLVGRPLYSLLATMLHLLVASCCESNEEDLDDEDNIEMGTMGGVKAVGAMGGGTRRTSGGIGEIDTNDFNVENPMSNKRSARNAGSQSSRSSQSSQSSPQQNALSRVGSHESWSGSSHSLVGGGGVDGRTRRSVGSIDESIGSLGEIEEGGKGDEEDEENDEDNGEDKDDQTQQCSRQAERESARSKSGGGGGAGDVEMIMVRKTCTSFRKASVELAQSSPHDAADVAEAMATPDGGQRMPIRSTSSMLYEFAGEEEKGHLSVKQGDVIHLLDEHLNAHMNPGWSLVEHEATGETGYVPSAYVSTHRCTGVEGGRELNVSTEGGTGTT